MILLIGSQFDPVLQHLARYIQAHVASACCFIDQAALGRSIFLKKQHWQLPEKTIEHHMISGVFNRLVTLPKKQRQHQRQQWIRVIDHLNHFEGLVINRPHQTLSNSSKMLQLNLLPSQSPLKKPMSLLLANYRMRSNARKKLIYKSASSVRSIVSYLPGRQYHIANEPVLLQQCIRGLNIRTHVIGKTAFSLAIKSQAIDYRYCHKQSFQAVTLPKVIEKACCDFADNCDLLFAGIDLIHSGENYYVLEANPSPGYSFFEQAMPDPLISKQLIQYLCGAIT